MTRSSGHIKFFIFLFFLQPNFIFRLTKSTGLNFKTTPVTATLSLISRCLSHSKVIGQHQLIFTAKVTPMKLEIILCYREKKKVQKKKAEEKTLKAAIHCSLLYYGCIYFATAFIFTI